VVRRARLSGARRGGPAVEAVELSKSFKLPHDERRTLKAHFLHPFRGTTYETNRAVQDVTFSVPHGEFFGVIGTNGSGKSTLLKLIAGIYRADHGSVRIDGRLSPFIELGVGFNPELNARDNVRINGTLMGLTSRQIQQRFEEIIEFAELERFVDQRLKNYSSGMQLRLAYAISIQVPFEILLLDEVLAVGDHAFQTKCFATFDRMKEEGKTMVFVSHDLASVARYCDRALLLHNGVVQAIGPAEEVVNLYHEPEPVA